MLLPVADVHQRFHERFPVTGPCSYMQIRQTSENRFVSSRRRYRRESISAAAFAGFKHRHTTFFCCDAVEYLTFTSATTHGTYRPFPSQASQTAGTISVTSVHFSQSEGRTARDRLAQYGALPHGYETLRVTCSRVVLPLPRQQ